MSKHTTTHSTDDIQSLAADAKALLVATAGVAEDKVVEARKRLAEALSKGQETLERVQERALESARAADEVIREHPYQAIGIAFGVGAVIGYLVSRRNSS